MQIDKLFTAIWHNTTTWPGTPLTGLSATITIREKPSNTIVVNNQSMTEVGLGEYDYTFITMDWTKAYSYQMNPNTTNAYIVSWYVDPRMSNLDKSITDIWVWIAWWRINDEFNKKDRKLIQETHEKVLQLENTNIEEIWIKLNEIDSHIKLANNDVISTIKQTNSDISKESISTRKLIRQKTEKLDKNISKLSDRQDLTDKMIEDEADEIEIELNQIYNKECDMIENEIIKQHEKEADDIESELNQ